MVKGFWYTENKVATANPQLREIAINGLRNTPGICTRDAAAELINSSEYYACIFELRGKSAYTRKVLLANYDLSLGEFEELVKAVRHELPAGGNYFWAIANSGDDSLIANTNPRKSKINFQKLMKEGRHF